MQTLTMDSTQKLALIELCAALFPKTNDFQVVVSYSGVIVLHNRGTQYFSIFEFITLYVLPLITTIRPKEYIQNAILYANRKDGFTSHPITWLYYHYKKGLATKKAETVCETSEN